MQCISLRPVIDRAARPPDRPRGAPVLLEFAALLNHQLGLQRSTTACGRCWSRCSSRARPPWGQARFSIFKVVALLGLVSSLFGSSLRAGPCLVVVVTTARACSARRARGAPARRGRARHGCGARGRRRWRQRQRAAVLRAARAGTTFPLHNLWLYALDRHLARHVPPCRSPKAVLGFHDETLIMMMTNTAEDFAYFLPPHFPGRPQHTTKTVALRLRFCMRCTSSMYTASEH